MVGSAIEMGGGLAKAAMDEDLGCVRHGSCNTRAEVAGKPRSVTHVAKC